MTIWSLPVPWCASRTGLPHPLEYDVRRRMCERCGQRDCDVRLVLDHGKAEAVEPGSRGAWRGARYLVGSLSADEWLYVGRERDIDARTLEGLGLA